jgi:hypothetical protein
LKKSLLVYICPTVYQANKVFDSIEYTENMPRESMKTRNENAFATNAAHTTLYMKMEQEMERNKCEELT